jgi:hypothetical protein
MKRKKMFLGVLMLVLASIPGYTQESESKLSFNPSLDIYTNYIFRGTRYGQGPSLQPDLNVTYKGFTAGVWGAFDVSGYAETDPYISYTFPFGLSIGLTDYYFQQTPLFDFSGSDGSHALEINLGFVYKNIGLQANYVINEAGGPGSTGGDMYFHGSYYFPSFEVFAGAGDGWHTSDGNFNLCNLGIGTTRQLTITDKFSIPLTGQVIVNPEREQLFIVIGLTL